MDLIEKAPLHLWITGFLATLWNGFGAVDYVLTQAGNDAYLAQFTPVERAYFDGLPWFVDSVWALGVWGAVIGSLLLLARRRHAVAAFAVSLFGLAASDVYQIFVSQPPGSLVNGVMIFMNILIWTVAIGLFVYAWRMRGAGVLR